MKLLRNLGGALSLALLIGLVVSSVPLGAQTVTAFTAERALSLSNILTTVTPMASPAVLAAIAAGASGLLVEVHPTPDRALSDGYQSLYPQQFAEVVSDCRAIAELLAHRHSTLS